MRQVFRARPWVLPPEPAKLAELFRDGHVVTLDAGATFRHGGTEGYVALLLEGLVTFSFLDIRGNYHTFALVLPGRTMAIWMLSIRTVPVSLPSVFGRVARY